MEALAAAGMTPQDHLLDIGCGALRLGHLAMPFLDPGHYWGTDASLALMQHGRAVELADPGRLPLSNLVQDADFAFPGIPETITLAIAFAVFSHLPAPVPAQALATIRQRFPQLRRLLFTVFLAPENAPATRQPDGVVTHPDRPPYHVSAVETETMIRAAGFVPARHSQTLPRGQVLWSCAPPQIP
jgi:SAM-dependent methyltransferase